MSLLLPVQGSVSKPDKAHGFCGLYPRRSSSRRRADERGLSLARRRCGPRRHRATAIAVRKETATMDDVVERFGARKQSYVKTEEWATEDAKYGELLRIAKAVEEVRR